MFTDIVGYTALMGKDEALAIDLLKRNRKVHKPLIEKHNGELLKEMGDGILASFTSAVQATECALEIQSSLQDDPELNLRIGIHIGDVIFDEGDIFGEGVNVASRLEPLAEPGGIYVSERVYDDIRNKPDFETVFLGEQSLKNVDHPVKVYALAGEGLPTPSPEILDEGRAVKRDNPHNLPNPATRFFGLKKELVQLKDLLSDHRLVTVQGPGGCGKSRLAIRVARESLNLYPDGVWFVALAQLDDPGLVSSTLAAVLQVQPVKDKPIEETVVERITDKKILVVIDNCEHLIEECARILNLLVTGTEIPHFLATSRETINISGESVFHIPPLSVPGEHSSIDEIKQFDSVQLFRDRVLLNKSDFVLGKNNSPVISSICQKLNGIPLAIEMAASRVKMMDPAAILVRLSDQLDMLSTGERSAPSRQKTVRATIDWSYDLLPEDEKALFERLAVFSGDFDLEDAENVCGYAPLPASQVLDLLTHLVDKSLVMTVEINEIVRYSLLETMQQYGVEKVSGKGELDALQERYCNYYLDTAGMAFEERMWNSAKWFGWFILELNNLQGALKILQSEPEKRLNLASHLAEFISIASSLGVGRMLLNTALEATSQRNVDRARTLGPLGWMELFYMNSELGYQKTKEGYEIAQELGDKQAKMDINWYHGMNKILYKEWGDAYKILEEGLQLARDIQAPWMELRYNLCIGLNATHQLKPELIENEIEGLLKEAIKAGNGFDILLARHVYADMPLINGDYELAEKRYMEAAKGTLEIGAILQSIVEMQGMAMSLAGQGRHEKGLRLFGAAVARFEELGGELFLIDFWMTLINRTLGKSMEILGPEKSQSLDLEGRQMGFEKAFEYAFAVDKD